MNYMEEADDRPRLALCVVRIPAEYVDVAFGVVSLFKVEERSLLKFRGAY